MRLATPPSADSRTVDLSASPGAHGVDGTTSARLPFQLHSKFSGERPVPQEIYPNAPIALMACEVRLPPGGLPILDDQIAEFRSVLADTLPVGRSFGQQQVAVQFGPDRMGPPSVTETRIIELTNRPQSVVVQAAPDSIVVKTADYTGWDEFRPLLSRVLVAARDVLDPDGFLRVGLRYVDEIRLPDGAGKDLSDWGGYVEEALLAPVPLESATDALRLRGWQTVVQFEAGEQHAVVIRYGPGEGFAVPPSELPRRPRMPSSGPFFMFDVDSFWETGGAIPEFDPDGITALCDNLHAPVRGLFEAAITERLRDDVLRKEPV